uniref:Anthocyanin 5-aromatic acyltransferase n=1 Tax=Leersia perrieri TaxID=77586 RepID=A0A0D9X4W9_9ORYZ
MAPPSVTIIEETRVAAAAAADGGTTREPSVLFKLSALDAQWITLPLIQRVLVFDAGAGDIPPFDAVVASLRASLSATLARLIPLAGRIVHLPDSGDAAIDCSQNGGGVRFVVAECDGVDATRLAGDADHDVEAFERLAPVLEAEVLPAETMAVQVTRLAGAGGEERGGGVAIGVAMHHAVVDGRSVWRFIEAWAAACRGDEAWREEAAAATFDRAAVAIPGGEELARGVLRNYAPNLPVATVPEFLVKGRLKLSRRTFTVAPPQIHRLKHRIISAAAGVNPSTFVTLASLAWVSFVKTKHAAGEIADDDDVHLFFFIDIRGRAAAVDPPVSDSFFGTCISGCLAAAAARDLVADCGDAGLAAAAAAVQGEVRRAAEDPLARWEWMSLVGRVPLDRLVNMSGSTRFPAYEAADFGWGSPARTELVTMNHDGQVVLVAAAAGGGGGVQASVAMKPAQMEAFTSEFESYLG